MKDAPPTERNRDGAGRSCRLDTARTGLDSWEFLGSEYAGQIYASLPIDDRLEGYLLNRGLITFAKDGSASDALLERVMANIGLAHRNGTLASQTN